MLSTGGRVTAATPMCFSKSCCSERSDCSAGIAGGANLTSQMCTSGRLRKRAQTQLPNTVGDGAGRGAWPNSKAVLCCSSNQFTRVVVKQ